MKFKTSLLLFCLTTLSLVAGAAGSRLGVLCEASDEIDRTGFVCRVLEGGSGDVFHPDRWGGVVELGSSSAGLGEVLVRQMSIGVDGRGGARAVGGKVEVVDGAGRVTHRDFEPVAVKPFVPNASSVAVFGDAGESPVTIDVKSPVAGVGSGKALFAGDAKEIRVDVSGRDGADGRSAGTAAALQILRGELGDKASFLSVVNGMGLDETVKSPSVALSDLAANGGRCEAMGGGFLTPEATGDGLSVLARVEKASEQLVSRSICERLTEEEYAIQTVCSRPPEVNHTLMCAYPAISRRYPIWRHPVEQKKVEFSCSTSIPPGRWETTCADELFAVAGSVVRAEYISLAPSQSIRDGMALELSHDFSSDPPCRSAPGKEPATFTSAESKLVTYDTYFSKNGPYGPNPLYEIINGARLYTDDTTKTSPSVKLYQSCDGKPIDKMDVLRETGALVYRNERKSVPGSADERSEGAPDDITKLTYWLDKSKNDKIDSRGLDGETSSPARLPYDDIPRGPSSGKSSGTLVGETPADLNPSYAYADPATESNEELREKKKDFFAGLEKLGFEKPSLRNAVVSYKKVDVSRQNETNGMRQVICRFFGDTATSIGGGRYRLVTGEIVGSNRPEDMASFCDAYLKRVSIGSPSLPTFREKIVYTYDELKAGLALKGKYVNEETQDHYLRSVVDVQLQPRIVYIPGDLQLKPITTIKFCDELTIDSAGAPVLSNDRPHTFIAPEVASGSTIRSWIQNGGQQLPYTNWETADSMYDHAPSAELYPWASAFITLRQTSPACVGQKTITQNVPSDEADLLKRLRGANGLLIVAFNKTINVYHSPIRLPRQGAGKPLYLTESMRPGLYAPIVSVAPAKLVGDDPDIGAYAGADGYGRPTSLMREKGSDSPLPPTLNPAWKFSLVPDTANELRFYAVPTDVGLSSDVAAPFPWRSFKTTGAPLLDGSPAGSEGAFRTSEHRNGTIPSDTPRYIKTLVGFKLLHAAGASGTTPVQDQRNVRRFPNVVLTKRLGKYPGLGSPTARCDIPVSSLSFPSKLISRRVEGESDPTPFSDDPNVIVDKEVTGGYNKAAATGFFSRPFLPTTLAEPEGAVRSIEEPVNLAQNYNAFLAQVSAATSLVPVTGRDGFGLRFDDAQRGPYAVYDQTLRFAPDSQNGRGLKNVLLDISKRGFVRTPFSRWSPEPENRWIHERIAINDEISCLASTGNDPSCIKWRRNEPYRFSRPPFLTRRRVEKNPFGNFITHMTVPLFGSVREWQQIYRRSIYFSGKDGGAYMDWNNTCIDTDDWTKKRYWDGQKTFWGDPNPPLCYSNRTFFKGLFLPLARTGDNLFLGPRGDKWKIVQADNMTAEKKTDENTFAYGDILNFYGSAAGKSFAGPEDGVGGDYPNPGGLALPPFGADIQPYFDRIGINVNYNCRKPHRKDDSIGCNPVTGQGCDWVCQSDDGFHTQDVEGWVHVWHGSNGHLDKDGIGNQGDRNASQVHIDHIDKADPVQYSTRTLSMKRSDGFLFKECQDDLDAETVVNSENHLVSGLKVSSDQPFETAYLPIGLRLAQDGGLYFGPLWGNALLPVLSPISSYDAASYARNDLYVSRGAGASAGRDVARIPVYPSLTREDEVARLMPRADDLSSLSVAIPGRAVTIGRILQDASNSVAQGAVSPFVYESPVALSPELLLAFFVHSDLGADQAGKSQMKPSDGAPRYFSEMVLPFLDFLSDRVGRDGLFRDQISGGEDVNGFVLTYPDAFPRRAIRFAWRWDENSIHSTVVGMNVQNATNVAVRGGIVSGADGVRSGVGVTWGGAGVFGKMEDQARFGGADGEDLNRSIGLTSPLLMRRSFGIQPADGSLQSAGIEKVINLALPAPPKRPYYFADGLCTGFPENPGEARTSVLLDRGAATFVIDPTDTARPKVIGSWDKVCVSAALRRAIDNVRNPPPGSNTICGPGADENPNCHIEDNIYWMFVKKDVPRSPLTSDPPQRDYGFEDPSRPPSCPAGTVVRSQNFVASGLVDVSTYKAVDGWAGAKNPATAPSCPDEKPLEVSSVYKALFENQGACYDTATGLQIPDLRTSRGQLTCPGATDGGSYRPTVVELTPGLYKPVGTIESTSYTPPSGALSDYTIFVGTREGDVRTIEAIRPSALLAETGWVPDDETSTPPSCETIPYDPATGLDMTESPVGMPRLSALWSFVDTKTRYGALDPYVMRTREKQVRIPVNGKAESLNISHAADACSLDNMMDATPVLKGGQQTDETPPTERGVFTYPVAYNWTAGAGGLVTPRQPTPWSSERTDGSTSIAPPCEMFNDESKVATEAVYPAREGSFTVGEGPLARSFVSNPKGALDSSLSNPDGGKFIVGGYWSKVGEEAFTLTRENSRVSVDCRVYVDPETGADSCTANIPVSYDTVDGFQITMRAESGESGGSAGAAVVLTREKPTTVEIRAAGGRAGAAGSTSFTGSSAVDRRLVCYKRSDDPLRPWIKVYRFNRSVVTVAPGSDGNPGAGGEDRVFQGWGVAKDALDWLKERVSGAVGK